MFGTWTTRLLGYRLSPGVPANPNSKPGRRSGFERLEGRLVMSANLGEVRLEALPLDPLRQQLDVALQPPLILAGEGQTGSPPAAALFDRRPRSPGSGDEGVTNPSEPPWQDSYDLHLHWPHSNGTAGTSGPTALDQLLIVALVVADRHDSSSLADFLEFKSLPDLPRASGPYRFEPLVWQSTLLAIIDDAGSPVEPPTQEQLFGAAVEREGSATDAFAGSGPWISAITALPEPATPRQASTTTVGQLDSPTTSSRSSVSQAQLSSARQFASGLNNGVRPLAPAADASIVDLLFTKIAPEGQVDIGGMEDNVFSSQVGVDHRQQAEHKLRGLLHQLHAPPARSVEPDALRLLPTAQLQTSGNAIIAEERGLSGDLPDDDTDSGEGGLVLLPAAPRLADRRPLLVDEALTELGDLWDVHLRIEPALGAYQAFDVGRTDGASQHESHRGSSSSKPAASRPAAETATKPTSRTTGVTLPTAAGILVSAAAAVSIPFGWWRRRRDATTTD